MLVAIPIEMFAFLLPLDELLSVTTLIALASVIFYHEWHKELKEYLTLHPQDQIPHRTYLSSEPYVHYPTENIMNNIPEVFRPGSAAEQIKYLRQQESR